MKKRRSRSYLAVIIVLLCVFTVLTIKASAEFFQRSKQDNLDDPAIISDNNNDNDNDNENDQTPGGQHVNAPAEIITGIDYGKLEGLESEKIEWGVVMGKDGVIPHVPDNRKLMLEKYNSHYMGDPSKQTLYLIFSASYDNGNMAKVLDTLKDKNVKAVFYLVGDFVRAYPDLVKRIINEGHGLGNHSSKHNCLPLVDNNALNSEVVLYHNYISETFGYTMKHFMPPSGEYSEKVLALANEMGYVTQFWSVAYDDYDPAVVRGEDYAFNVVTRHIHNGAFVFLHTVSHDNTAALGRIIDYCREKGYTFDIFS